MQQKIENCSICGVPVLRNARFCTACGAALPLTEAISTGPVEGGNIDASASVIFVDDDPPFAASMPFAPVTAIEPPKTPADRFGRTEPIPPANQMSVGTTDILPEGTQLGNNGRYHIQRLLGAGGFGQAYQAQDTLLERVCVIKRLVPKPTWDADTQQRVRQNFEREARLLVTLNQPGNPHIPEIFEYLTDSDCLVMKYIVGQNLDQLLRQRGGSLPESEALTYIRAVCSALVYMHNHAGEPILHRDIKPANILVDASEQVWIIDFGLSKAIPVFDEMKAFAASRASGTRGYAPAEQIAGAAEPRSDVYSLGVTLHTLLTGYLPFLHEDKELPSARDLNPLVSAAVASLIERSTRSEPAERPTASEFLSALDAVIRPTTIPSIHTPNGVTLADEIALVGWCEANWALAIDWLYSTLPDQIEQFWGKTRLATRLRDTTRAYAHDRSSGLDTALTLLDPQDFGMARPQISTNSVLIDFGLVGSGELAEQTMMVQNTGRRLVRAQIRTPEWIQSSPPIVTIAPAQHTIVRLICSSHSATQEQMMRDTVQIRAGTITLLQIPAQATIVSRWRSIWNRYRQAFLLTPAALVLIGFILVFGYPMLAELRSRPVPWESFRDSQGRFSIEFPAQPFQSSQVITFMLAQTEVFIARQVTTDAIYQVEYFDLPDQAGVKQSTEIISTVEQMIISNLSGTRHLSKDIVLEENPGRLFEAEARINGTAAAVIGNIYLVGERVYIITMYIPLDKQDQVDKDRFPNSFSLLK